MPEPFPTPFFQDSGLVGTDSQYLRILPTAALCSPGPATWVHPQVTARPPYFCAVLHFYCRGQRGKRVLRKHSRTFRDVPLSEQRMT